MEPVRRSLKDTINIFGGTGFVGSAYARYLAQQEHDRVVRWCEENNIRHFYAMEFSCILNDRNDHVPKTNNIVYFISTVDNYNVFTDPHLDIDTNLTTLINVLSNITDKENTVFNFISSWFVYGDTELPAKETSPCNPKGFYSITKRAAEQLLISYCETFGIKYRILRLANVVGKGDMKAGTKKNAIAYMIGQLQQNNPINLYDGGELYRDVISLDDCVRAINLVVTAGELNTIYNIGNGVPIKLYDIIHTAKEMLQSTSEIHPIDPPKFHQLVQVKSMYMDNTKLKALGYTPQDSIRSIIQHIID